MIPNKYHHNNRHSRGVNSTSVSADSGLPTFGEGGNPAIQKCSGFIHWIPASAEMTKILIAIYMLTPFVLTNSAQAGNLGRLFFTPEQRAQLEHKRTRNATTAEVPSSSVLTVNGIVQRHGGARTVWINGVAQNAGNSDERSPEALPVSVPGQSHPVKVKVGQKLILNQPAQKNPPMSAPQKQPASDE
jgi:hypothetical protein